MYIHTYIYTYAYYQKRYSIPLVRVRQPGELFNRGWPLYKYVHTKCHLHNCQKNLLKDKKVNFQNRKLYP